jgi:hypothetical protein
MAGKLASADLVGGADTMIWQNNTGAVVTVNIRFCNRTTSDTAVRVAIGPAGGGASPVAADYVTYDATLLANGILEDTGQRVDPLEKLYVRSAASNVSVRAFGA